MKKNFWKKLLAILGLGVAVFSMSACQSVEHNARVVPGQSEVKVAYDVGTGKFYADILIAVENPSIFDAKKFELSWEAYNSEGTLLPDLSGKIESREVRIAHGAYGYVVDKVDDIDPSVASIKVTGGPALAYYNVWETYLAWWIIAITVVSISLICYCATIFTKGLTREDMVNIFKENLANSIVFMLLLLIICLVPLMFSNWVVTCILLGSYASFLLLSGGVTLLRTSTAKN